MAVTVLIVDDHGPFRASAHMLLELDGFDVVGEAEDGSSGLDLARALSPDVVPLDIALPDMSGFDVAERLAGETRSDHDVEPAVLGLRRPRAPERPRLHPEGRPFGRGDAQADGGRVRAAKFGLSALAVTLAYVAYRVQLDNLGGATTSGRALAIVTIGVAFVIAGTIAWSKRYPNRIAPLRTIRSRT